MKDAGRGPKDRLSMTCGGASASLSARTQQQPVEHTPLGRQAQQRIQPGGWRRTGQSPQDENACE